MTDVDGRVPFAELNGTPVYFDEDWETGIGGGLWSTGLAMAKYMEHHTAAVQRNLNELKSEGDRGVNFTALELGSGNGFLSVCLAAVAGGSLDELVVTDLADHLPLIEKTLALNSHVIDPSSVKVLEHRWGDFDGAKDRTLSCDKKFDFIFGSDLAYRDDLHHPLISSLVRLCHDRTVALIGVTMSDTKPKFFKALTAAGFRYDRLADILLDSQFRGTTFGLFAIERSRLGQSR